MQELAALKQKQHTNGVPQVDSNVVASSNAKVASLEVKVARLEHKCLELVAEKQMELDAATVPRWFKHTLRQGMHVYLKQSVSVN